MKLGIDHLKGYDLLRNGLNVGTGTHNYQGNVRRVYHQTFDSLFINRGFLTINL